jgi:hypothetical protein
VRGNALEARLSIPGLDRFADLEPPFPPVLVNLHKGKFNAFAVHLQPLYSSRYAMVFAGLVFYWSVIGEQHTMITPQRRSSRMLNVAQSLEKDARDLSPFGASGFAARVLRRETLTPDEKSSPSAALTH